MNFAITSLVRFPLALVACFVAVGIGCQYDRRSQVQLVQQEIDDSKTSSDNLREGMRYLSQMNALNRFLMAKEVQVQLNTWAKNVDARSIHFVPCRLVADLPAQLLAPTGLDQPAQLEYSYADVEYMYQCRQLRELSNWIVERPLRDSLLVPVVERQKAVLPEGEFTQLEQAVKLFDWTMRNVMLLGEAKDVEHLADDPRMPLLDANIGYGYLPWQAVLFSRGDFAERGRVFSALALQRGIQTAWVGIEGEPGTPTKLWSLAVWVGKQCYLLEPKLGLPILDPDSLELATLDRVANEERILRRLSLPGRFEYAVKSVQLKQFHFLIDAEANSLTARMKLLESKLLANERMSLHFDADALATEIANRYPQAKVSLWQTPLMARIYADLLVERLEQAGPFTAKYMLEHAVWLAQTPVATARQKHLRGEFENTLDAKGALAEYMACRLPDEALTKLPFDADLQKELGIPRLPNEPIEQFDARLRQAQSLFGDSKLDASFLLGQLQFDLGNYESSIGWLKKRTVEDPRAARWYSAAWYTLARAYQERGELENCIAALAHEPSPSEAGNRLRARYLTRGEK